MHAVEVVAGTNLLYIPECVGAPVITEYFIAGLEPVESCDPWQIYYAPGARPDSLAGDSSGAPSGAPPGGAAPPGRRATVPAPDTLFAARKPRRRRCAPSCGLGGPISTYVSTLAAALSCGMRATPCVSYGRT